MEKIKVLAKIDLVKGDKGRRSPIISGYRPHFEFVGARTRLSGRIDLINLKELPPGGSATVQLTFLTGMISNSHFKVGSDFKFSEGSVPIGEGVITEILELPDETK